MVLVFGVIIFILTSVLSIALSNQLGSQNIFDSLICKFSYLSSIGSSEESVKEEDYDSSTDSQFTEECVSQSESSEVSETSRRRKLDCSTSTEGYVKIGTLSNIKEVTQSYSFNTNEGPQEFYYNREVGFEDTMADVKSWIYIDLYKSVFNTPNYIYYFPTDATGTVKIFDKSARTLISKVYSSDNSVAYDKAVVGDILVIAYASSGENPQGDLVKFDPKQGVFTSAIQKIDTILDKELINENLEILRVVKIIDDNNLVFSFSKRYGPLPDERYFKLEVSEGVLSELIIDGYSPNIVYIQNYGEEMIFGTYSIYSDTYTYSNDYSTDYYTYNVESFVFYNPTSDTVTKEITIIPPYTANHGYRSDELEEVIFLPIQGIGTESCYYYSLKDNTYSQLDSFCLPNGYGGEMGYELTLRMMTARRNWVFN